MKKCPECELNYIEDSYDICTICSQTVTPQQLREGGKSYYEMGLKNGDKIVFIPEPKYFAIISSEYQVEFERKEWKITNLAIHLFERIGNTKKANSYKQGGSGNEVFTYDDNDPNLYVRWYRFKENQ